MLSRVVFISSFAMSVLFTVASIWIFFTFALTAPLASLSDGKSPQVALHVPAAAGFTRNKECHVLSAVCMEEPARRLQRALS